MKKEHINKTKKQKEPKKIMLIIGISIILITCILLISKLLNKHNNEISILLNSNSYFQDSIGIGSNFTGLYHFKNDNTFKFSNKENIINNNQTIYMTGTWKYKNNYLTLTINEEQIAQNGTKINDPIKGEILTNYTIKKNITQKTKKYMIKMDNIDGIKYITGEIILYNVNLTQEEINYYFDSNSNNITNCSVTTKNATEFLQKIIDFKNNCQNYEVSYKNLKYVAQINHTAESYDAYINKIYHSNTELKNISINGKIHSNLQKTYLLEDPNSEKLFLLEFYEVPATQFGGGYIIIFNEKGEIKLSNEYHEYTFDDKTNELTYVVLENEFKKISNYSCDSLKQHDTNKIYKTNYTYKYTNGKMELIKSEETTIESLLKLNNCN